MPLIWLLVGFALFMALIWSVYAVNRTAAMRFGYEPFSLPNAALMLVANLLLLSALVPVSDAEVAQGAASAYWVKLGVALLIAGLSLVIIARRTGVLMALYAVALLSVLAIAVLPSLLFMGLAGSANLPPTDSTEGGGPIAPGDDDR
jgi:hypothetical protein